MSSGFLLPSIPVIALPMSHPSDWYRPSIRSIPRCRSSLSGKSCFCPTVQHLIQAQSLSPTELLIIEICIVNDLSDALHSGRLGSRNCLDSVSNEQSPPRWPKPLGQNMSKGMASEWALGSAAKTKRAFESMNRRISHADETRSIPGRGRVSHPQNG